MGFTTRCPVMRRSWRQSPHAPLANATLKGIERAGWVSGKGRGAVWRAIPRDRKQIEPQFLMAVEDYYEKIEAPWRPKVAHMAVGSATNARTAIGTVVCGAPGSHKAPMLYTPSVSRALTAREERQSVRESVRRRKPPEGAGETGDAGRNRRK